jgi:hypothetical protein
MELGESFVGVVLDYLLPSLKELPEPLALLNFLGNTVVSNAFTEGPQNIYVSLTRVGPRASVGKGFAWSRGLGCEISPIKTQSARKRDEFVSLDSDSVSTSVTDFGALRGIKALACKKS